MKRPPTVELLFLCSAVSKRMLEQPYPYSTGFSAQWAATRVEERLILCSGVRDKEIASASGRA